jgi:hypothetical protein
LSSLCYSSDFDGVFLTITLDIGLLEYG